MTHQFKNWGAGVADKDKRKKVIVIILIFSLQGLFIFYLLFYIKISKRIILLLPISNFIISLAFAVFIALIFSFRRKSLINKSIKTRVTQYGNRFFSIACSCFLIIFPLFDYYVYLFPKKTNTYLTHYEITIPGPSIGRSSRCEKGIKIQDQYTSERFFICFYGEKYAYPNTQALVTVQSNAIGSYLVHYGISQKNRD